MSKEVKQGSVLIMGSINTDLVARSPHLPRPGETISGHEFSQISGGKGANQAVAAARIGGRVVMAGCVGADANGALRLAGLEAEGIDCSAVETDPSVPTGVAIVTVADDGQNTIVVVAGSNGQVTPEMVKRHEAVIKAADVVVCQLETPWDSVHATLLTARRFGKLTVLNPAPATGPLPAEWLPLVDYLVPNEVEAAILAGAGLRRSEVVALDVGDYEVESGKLTVRQGKGRKDRITFIKGGGAKWLARWLTVRGLRPTVRRCDCGSLAKI